MSDRLEREAEAAWDSAIYNQKRAEKAEEEVIALRQQLEQANKRYENRAPTQWAYDQACKALQKHKARADAAEKQLERAREKDNLAQKFIYKLQMDLEQLREALRDMIEMARPYIYPQPDKPNSKWAKLQRARENLKGAEKEAGDE